MTGAGDGQDEKAVDAELVAALFRTLPPTLIMTALYLLTGLLALQATRARFLVPLLVGGAFFSICRIVVVLHGRSVATPVMEAAEARVLERRFAVTFLPFAAMVGLLAAGIFVTAHGTAQGGLRIIAAVLVVGYAAGVAAGVYVRPWICLPAIVLGVGPLTLLAAWSTDGYDRFLALAMCAFAAGGIESSQSRYRSEKDKIAQRQKLAAISRQDELTGLPNQLALVEAIEAGLAGNQPLWLHLIEVRGLALVNERLGLVGGDEVVRDLAARLGRAVGGDGFVARIGGGQFGVLQAQRRHADEAGDLIRAIAGELRALDRGDGTPLPLTAFIASEPAVAGLSAKQWLAVARDAERREIATV